jgi:hypothetical protein
MDCRSSPAMTEEKRKRMHADPSARDDWVLDPTNAESLIRNGEKPPG